MVPFTEFLTGAVYTSPSGILQRPAHFTAGISFMENVKSVSFATILTLSV